MRYSSTIIHVLSIVSLVLLLSSALIPSVNSEQNSDGAEMPEWHEEDQWTYDVIPMTGQGDLTLYVNNTPIDEKDKIKIDDKEYEIFKVDHQMRGEFGKSNDSFRQMDVNKTFYYVKDTLKVVSRMVVNGTIYHYKPPWKRFDFPIKVGKSWTSNSTVLDSSGSALGNQVFLYNCTDKVQVSVPAGNYSAYRIERTRTLNDPLNETDLVMYYSPKVENTVKTVYNNVKGQPQYIEELRSYELAEPKDDKNRTPSLGTGTLLGVLIISAIFVAKYRSKER